MGYLAMKLKVLKALEENLHNAHPQVMESRCIAEKLNINLKELKQIIRTMNTLGEVESDQDCERLLITQAGLQRLDRI